MRNSLFVILTLALVSFAQAGPFGLKSGMTVEEIIKAGFKTDEKKCHQLTGEKGKLPEKHILENIVYKKIKLSKDHLFFALINEKYPNSMFHFTINEYVGLTKLNVYVYCDDSELLDALYEKYKERIEKKYNNKFSEILGVKKYASRSLYLKEPNDYNLKNIGIKKLEYEIPKKNRLDSRTHTALLDIRYMFKSWDSAFEMERLAFQKELEDRKKKREKKVKDLLPKEEDL